MTATASSSTIIAVMWDEVVPIDQNGVITMYEVMYTPLAEFGKAGIMNVTYQYTSVVLTDLEEYVIYNISVRAYTQVGLGNSSSPVRVRTDEDGKVLITSLDIFVNVVWPDGCIRSLHCIVFV